MPVRRTAGSLCPARSRPAASDSPVSTIGRRRWDSGKRGGVLLGPSSASGLWVGSGYLPGISEKRRQCHALVAALVGAATGLHDPAAAPCGRRLVGSSLGLAAAAGTTFVPHF